MVRPSGRAQDGCSQLPAATPLPSCCEQNSVMTAVVVSAALIDDGFDSERLLVSGRS